MFQFNRVILFGVLFCLSESSTLKGLEEIEIAGIESTDVPLISFTEASTDEISTELPNHLLSHAKENSLFSEDELTEPATINNGTFFLLKMTVKESWTDNFMDKKSDSFNQLANSLGTELIDLIDNTQQSKQQNLTNFKLVEVRPSKESKDKVYVTFLVTAKNEISGEEMSNEIKNRVSIYGGIYTVQATIEGFAMTNITEDEANDLESEKVACSTDEGGNTFFRPETNATLISVDTPQPAESSEIFNNQQSQPKCQREKIQRGATSIYIFENQPKCFDEFRSENDVNRIDSKESEKCNKNFKRSANDDDETIVVIKKRGNKVFIEI